MEDESRESPALEPAAEMPHKAGWSARKWLIGVALRGREKAEDVPIEEVVA